MRMHSSQHLLRAQELRGQGHSPQEKKGRCRHAETASNVPYLTGVHAIEP